MTKIGFKSGCKVAVAIAVGLGGSTTFASQLKAPQNQRELEALALTNPAQLNGAGHAFDNTRAKLFWFTDLEAAKKQAKFEGKPILSLRLLGHLSDEYSCANSRFFRVIFYPQAQINPILREKFVLHWSTERAVPVVSIDMGDGRVVKRTLTGNSAHYLLDENGRPLDVMPGVVTPARFVRWLENGAVLGRQWKQTDISEREAFLGAWHRAQMGEIWREIEPSRGEDRKWVATQIEKSLELNPLEGAAPARIAAEVAGPLFVSKVGIEAPILDATRLFGSGARVAAVPMQRLDGAQRFLSFGKPAPVLDEATKARIKAMNPPLASRAALQSEANSPLQGAQIQSISKTTSPVAEPFAALIARFGDSVQQDDRMAVTRFLIPIHASFIQGQASDFGVFNRKIYDRLFLTPQSDKWLGLSPDGTFTALQNGGLFDAASARQ